MALPSLRELIQDGLTADNAVEIASICWAIASQGGPHCWFFLFINQSMHPLLDDCGPLDADAAEPILHNFQSAILRGLDSVHDDNLPGVVAAANEVTASLVALHLLSL